MPSVAVGTRSIGHAAQDCRTALCVDRAVRDRMRHAGGRPDLAAEPARRGGAPARAHPSGRSSHRRPRRPLQARTIRDHLRTGGQGAGAGGDRHHALRPGGLFLRAGPTDGHVDASGHRGARRQAAIGPQRRQRRRLQSGDSASSSGERHSASLVYVAQGWIAGPYSQELVRQDLQAVGHDRRQRCLRRRHHGRSRDDDSAGGSDDAGPRGRARRPRVLDCPRHRRAQPRNRGGDRRVPRVQRGAHRDGAHERRHDGRHCAIAQRGRRRGVGAGRCVGFGVGGDRDQRADGRSGFRAAVRLDPGDRPPGDAGDQRGAQGAGRDREARRPRSRRWPPPGRRSARSSTSSRRSPPRPTCSPSTRRSRRRAPARPAAASPSSPAR